MPIYNKGKRYLLKNFTINLLIAFLLMLCTNYAKAQGNSGGTPGGGAGGSTGGGASGGGGGTGGQCIPSNPAYDPCFCGDPACNVPLDSWVIYLVAGVVIFGFFRLKNSPLNTDKAA